MASSNVLVEDFGGSVGPIKSLVWSSGDIVRPMSWGTDWEEIRIGVLMSMAGTAIATPEQLLLGVGKADGYFNSADSHMVGVSLGGQWTSGGTFTGFVSGSGNGYWDATDLCRTGKSVNGGAVQNASAMNVGALWARNTTGTFRRSPIYVDISKTASGTAGIWTCSIHPPGLAQIDIDYDIDDFMAGMEERAAPFGGLEVPFCKETTTLNPSSVVPRTISVDEATDGPVDAFDFHWSGVNPASVRLYAYAIYRKL